VAYRAPPPALWNAFIAAVNNLETNGNMENPEQRPYIVIMDLHATVTEFFRDAVTDALRSRNVSAAEPTEFYIVNLLVEFTKVSRVDEEPLALKMAELAGATPDAKARGLKEIGDTSLYVTGFFQDSLSRRLVDVDYYIAMGESAYGQLAQIIGMTRGSATDFFRAVYKELAGKFATYVEVLNEVRRNTSLAAPGHSGANLVRLYEEWLKTGSEWLERRLREAGLLGPGALAGRDAN
jgi:hypothetical protein